MLARTTAPLPQPQCSTSMSLRATPLPLHHGRALVVPRSSASARSSSSRSDSWRSSWRTELEHGSNGNGNGAGHSYAYDESSTVYVSNSNGYHNHDGYEDGAHWGASAADWRSLESEEQPEDPEAAYSNGWYQNGTDAEELVEESASEEVDTESGGGGFFTDAFKDALKQALQRSPLYGDDAGSGYEESVDPEPHENEVEMFNKPIFTDSFRHALKESLARQQAEMDAYGGYGSDEEYTPEPYVPAAPARREMSPLEEVIATALGASQLHLRRLNLMKNEIEAAIERETKQIERLDFALAKTQTDVAYYKSLEAMMQERSK
ncbi:hypothetical protein PLESTF_000596800 [Pleodorina starrii]|nr:hypothetical protein PLESTF_000596800 [Pleodorina starrii]